MKNNQQRYKKNFDKNRRDIYYNVGDQVLKRLTSFPSKLSALYSHPMTIIKQQHPTYWIQDPNDQQIFQVHVSQLRPCKQISMNIKSTRSTNDLTQTSINSLLLPFKQDQRQLLTMDTTEQLNFDSLQTSIDLNKNDTNLMEQKTHMLGHDLHDQHFLQHEQSQQTSIQLQLRTIQKFDGHGDATLWLYDIMKKFDTLHLTAGQRYDLISDILTQEALVWYINEQDQMPTFNSFIKNFLRYFKNKELNQGQPMPCITSSENVKQQEIIDVKDSIIDSLRNQMMMVNLENLPKFTGKSKQNPSKWLTIIQEKMHLLKLTDEEKLSYIPLCLEAEARDWFYDNKHLILTWTTFTQKLIKTFESSGKADISFNRLRHYEQGINEDVNHYYFQIMKLCVEANPMMDDANKLQYLKDGLKPSLRFDVLLQNPTTSEKFLEYAQKVEELKSLDERQNIIVQSTQENFTTSVTINPTNRNINTQQVNQHSQVQPSTYNNTYYKANYKNNYKNNKLSQQPLPVTTNQDQYNYDIPKPPYQCYKCGANDHYIRNCPYFQ
ncbi:unnamed protein product [Rotaria sp. Silwood2]|nr:unnamed protein product [Rotaria sp. Silwood2]